MYYAKLQVKKLQKIKINEAKNEQQKSNINTKQVS